MYFQHITDVRHLEQMATIFHLQKFIFRDRTSLHVIWAIGNTYIRSTVQSWPQLVPADHLRVSRYVAATTVTLETSLVSAYLSTVNFSPSTQLIH